MKETKQHRRNSKKATEKMAETDVYADLVSQNIETVAALYAYSERGASPHQKAIERVTAFLGRPVFAYFILLFVVLWICINVTLPSIGRISFDPPAFYWLDGVISLSALLMSNMVLISQNRQKKLTEQRRHLDLQVNLLAEQKVTKLIMLVEELRRDIPSVKDRHDPEAEAMKASVDPHALLSTLNQALGEVRGTAEANTHEEQ